MKTNKVNLCLIFTIASVYLLGACSKLKETSTTNKTTFTKIDSLRSTYLALNDSIIMAWNVMMNDDNEKLSNLNRLLDEVIYAGGVDTSKVNFFKQKLSDLKKSRYDEMTMVNSNLIDEYDFATNSLVNEVVTFAESHNSFQRFPLMGELIKDVRAAEARILHHRINYDLFAKDYNHFLEEYKDILNEIENDVEHQAKPLFELPPESQ